MRFNITCEIDWIGENGSIDKEVQDRIILGVVHKLNKDMVEQIKKEAQNAAEKQITELVKITYDELLQKEVVVTDNYGDIKKKYMNVKEMIKDKLDRYLGELVNRNGEPAKYDGKPRFQMLVAKEIESNVAPWITKAVKDAATKMKSSVEAEIKKGFNEKMLGFFNIEKAIQQVEEVSCGLPNKL